jgi:hypothetical protein
VFLTEGDHVERQQQDIKETRGGVSDAMKSRCKQKRIPTGLGNPQKSYVEGATWEENMKINTQAKSKLPHIIWRHLGGKNKHLLYFGETLEQVEIHGKIYCFKTI